HATGKVEIGQIDASWFYNLTWQPQPQAQTPLKQANENETWLILADRQGIGAALAKLLDLPQQTATQAVTLEEMAVETIDTSLTRPLTNVPILTAAPTVAPPSAPHFPFVVRRPIC
ncbi:MAG: hypothetical protein HC915_14535, partial [Anaerolineae bacterium]|nr:hypothetical protein [Anaerolineae bacterium]